MSKLHFLIKYGDLSQAKAAVASSNKGVLGHPTSMVKLLTRMKNEGDPDYAKMRDEHFDEFANDRIKASWVVDSQHATPKHLTTIASKFPSMLDRVAKNKSADADTLRLVYQKSLMSPEGHEARRLITWHANAPKELIAHMAKNDPSMTVKAYAADRLKSFPSENK